MQSISPLVTQMLSVTPIAELRFSPRLTRLRVRSNRAIADQARSIDTGQWSLPWIAGWICASVTRATRSGLTVA